MSTEPCVRVILPADAPYTATNAARGYVAIRARLAEAEMARLIEGPGRA